MISVMFKEKSHRKRNKNLRTNVPRCQQCFSLGGRITGDYYFVLLVSQYFSKYSRMRVYQKTTICLKGGGEYLALRSPQAYSNPAHTHYSPELSRENKDQGLSFHGQWGALAGWSLPEEDTLTFGLLLEEEE